MLRPMNANETAPQASDRLKRIKTLSQILKVLFMFYFVILGLFLILTRKDAGSWTVCDQTYSKLSEVPSNVSLVIAIGGCLSLLMATAFYQLLNLYEKGVIFAQENVRLYKRLGYLAFSMGLLNVCAPVVATGHLGIFPTLFGIAGSPWVVGGLFVIIISSIMDEGRKIQEEQELTV